MDKQKIGRFDQSFVVRMIRDFFFVLLAVAIIEIGVRFVLVVYNYESEDKITTKLAADLLAQDLKSIMLNSGGPVAARTIYPIFKRNHRDMGFEIAIVPSEPTRTSIIKSFGFEPLGLSSTWSSGRHHETNVNLIAEQFCVSCHVDSKVGDVLGYVTVRMYLANRIEQWWEDVRLTSLLLLGNIIMHSVVLYIILKVRMEPVLSMLSAFSNLSKGPSDLSYRAEVKSHDEFGGLASDLNAFLDQVNFLIDDIRALLNEVVNAYEEIKNLNLSFKERLISNQEISKTTMKQFFEDRLEQNFATAQAVGELRSILSDIDSLTTKGGPELSLEPKLKEIKVKFEALFDDYKYMLRRYEGMGKELLTLSSNLYDLVSIKEDISVLEEKMARIAETGRSLLGRLSDSGRGT